MSACIRLHSRGQDNMLLQGHRNKNVTMRSGHHTNENVTKPSGHYIILPITYNTDIKSELKLGAAMVL
jgi:hypothetical protein